MDRRSWIALAVAVLVVAVALVTVEFGLWLYLVSPGEYDRVQLTVTDQNGAELATVDARVADTATKRAIGLSRTDSLGDEEGMLFVHEETGTHRYVMRRMALSLDIVFVAENGTIAEIHHADPAGALTPASLMERHAGTGRYVLEARRGWANESGVAVGDRVNAPAALAGTAGEGAPGGTPVSPTESPANTSTVRVADANGTRLGAVAVRIADTRSERHTGLSETAALPPDEGMLFVYGTEAGRSFVMREMDFPLDMIFVAADGTVTEIHHASVPPAGTDAEDLRRYRGRAQFVLEVNRGWTNETGLDVGDSVHVPPETS